MLVNHDSLRNEMFRTSHTLWLAFNHPADSLSSIIQCPVWIEISKVVASPATDLCLRDRCGCWHLYLYEILIALTFNMFWLLGNLNYRTFWSRPILSQLGQILEGVHSSPPAWLSNFLENGILNRFILKSCLMCSKFTIDRNNWKIPMPVFYLTGLNDISSVAKLLKNTGIIHKPFCDRR